ncbi:hypothetical protein Pcac1_g26866 [Phytophthora cactorum]|uniref:Uncharacterized protein n=1 Tax=Phytophthora cactorum TaxID=29920 RepID=A0A8T0Y6B7_9STRA|nr:hypothetical protein Pcac1_g26866 [Phytophthora cactorum]KAG2840746.1 hypothetical protein PC113_g19189 [Phytophthora cactorum]KAG2882471.1 hypothetical protein PC114_g21023 [Phytophthora cactorum]KAG2904978.1 hypothetical protein PC117_g20860 [Phytophthora cactorum]KAG2966967.1 hypothetical protein PC118_g18855 [Phytophthora cactorum]
MVLLTPTTKELLVAIPFTGTIKKDGEWLKVFHSDDELLQSGGISSPTWEILDNADNVMDPRSIVCDGGFEFRGMHDPRPYVAHAVALLPPYRDLSKTEDGGDRVWQCLVSNCLLLAANVVSSTSTHKKSL